MQSAVSHGQHQIDDALFEECWVRRHDAAHAQVSRLPRLASPRIPHLDPADMPEGRGNAGKAADSFFHPSRPLGSGYLVHRKSLIPRLESAHGAGKMPIHLGNPG